jgi:hypothetical protein
MKLRRWFPNLIAGIFALTALAKLFGVATGRIGNLGDPLFPMVTVAATALFAAGLELSCAAICFLGKSDPMKCGVLIWLSGIFLLYRCGLWAKGLDVACPCLGYLQFGSRGFTETLLSSLTVVLVCAIAGAAFLLLEARLPKSVTPPTQRLNEP